MESAELRLMHLDDRKMVAVKRNRDRAIAVAKDIPWNRKIERLLRLENTAFSIV